LLGFAALMASPSTLPFMDRAASAGLVLLPLVPG